jgi:Terpene synthase family 2, C-terminal metal binding
MELQSSGASAHVHGQVANAKTRAWVETNRLCTREQAAHLGSRLPGMFAAYVVPTEADPRFVELCGDYFSWLICFDDAIGECDLPAKVEVLMGHIAAVHERRAEHSAYVAAIEDLCRRGQELTRSPTWAKRFRLHVLDYMQGCLLEATYRLHKLVPCREIYDELRLKTIGGQPVLDIVEASTGLMFSPVSRKKLTTLMGYANDVVSYKACETERDEEDRLNIVRVLGSSEIAAQTYNRERQLLLGKGHSLFRRVIDGNLEWYRTSSRYRHEPASSAALGGR